MIFTAGAGETGATGALAGRAVLEAPARPAVTTAERLTVGRLHHLIASNSTSISGTHAAVATHRQLDTRAAGQARRRVARINRRLAALSGVPGRARALEDVQFASASSSVETVARRAAGGVASLARVAGRAVAAVGVAGAGTDAAGGVGARPRQARVDDDVTAQAGISRSAPALIVRRAAGHTRRPVETGLRRARAAAASVDRKLTPLAAISGRACADVQVDVVEARAVVQARTGSTFVHLQLARDSYRHRVQNRNRASLLSQNYELKCCDTVNDFRIDIKLLQNISCSFHL